MLLKQCHQGARGCQAGKRQSLRKVSTLEKKTGISRLILTLRLLTQGKAFTIRYKLVYNSISIATLGLANSRASRYMFIC